MLSTEIYESWKVKNADDPHLKELLQRIEAPRYLVRTSSENRQFRQSVIERLQRRHLDELIEIADSTPVEKRRCCWNFLRKKESANTEVIWRRTECKTMESFEMIAAASISSSLNCIRGLKAIIQSLSYWEDPHADWEGLSVLGSYVWLLSFAVQHLIDDNNPKGPMLPGVKEIKIRFQEIAQSGEVFSEMIENFHKHTHRVRTDAVHTVKKMIKKWKLEDKSPLLKRPEASVAVFHQPKRRLGNKGFLDLQDEMELCRENVFSMNWTPLTLMLRSSEIDWRPFGILIPSERVHWFSQFSQKTLDILELAAEDLTLVSGHISSINIEKGVDDSKSQTGSDARELSGALQSFANSCPSPKNPSPEEKTKMLKLLSEYWYAVDIMHEEGYTLLRLVHETRDIIRTCYVYMDTFYKWELPCYDAFLTSERKSKRKAGSQTMTNIRETWDKFLTKEGHEKKLSDVSEILVMMDFSTSAYQNIVELRPIECDGMFMKLESHNLDQDQEFGLVSGVDKRKSRRKLS